MFTFVSHNLTILYLFAMIRLVLDSDKEVTAKSDGDVNMNNLCGALGSIMSSYSFDSDTEQVDGKGKSDSISRSSYSYTLAGLWVIWLCLYLL